LTTVSKGRLRLCKGLATRPQVVPNDHRRAGRSFRAVCANSGRALVESRRVVHACAQRRRDDRGGNESAKPLVDSWLHGAGVCSRCRRTHACNKRQCNSYTHHELGDEKPASHAGRLHRRFLRLIFTLRADAKPRVVIAWVPSRSLVASIDDPHRGSVSGVRMSPRPETLSN
jgi:hypothetical protein